jgi:hypothetical protein
MGIKLKSLASALALGFALLAFGPATSKAKADPLIVQAGVAPVRHHAYVRPYYRYGPRVGYAYPRPYRVVRVFVPLPFPHWVHRRVYYTAPYYAGPYAGAYFGY